MKMFAKVSCLVTAMVWLAGVKAEAQTNTIVYNFTNYFSGLRPQAELVVVSNTLYGTTSYGSPSVFKINTDGSGFSVINKTLSQLNGGLTINGNILYGTGSSIFRASTSGTNFTLLAYMVNSSKSGLVLGGDALYGTIRDGRSSDLGSIIKINTDGSGFMTLHNFTNNPDGTHPQAGLVLGGNTLYGTTFNGGSSDNGVVFKINVDGTGYAILYDFSNSPDGANPQADLALRDNVLYGTTRNGGGAGNGTVFKINTNGSGYAILRSFTNYPDGMNPQAGLLLRGNTLFGTTYNGGTWRYGTVFEMNLDGTGYVILKSFAGYLHNDGGNPSAKLVIGDDGLYGTTENGGSSLSQGTIFRQTLAPPQLQIAAAGAAPVVFWQDDGFNRTLQTTTNLKSGTWSTVSNSVSIIGLQVTNAVGQPHAFFRLQ